MGIADDGKFLLLNCQSGVLEDSLDLVEENVKFGLVRECCEGVELSLEVGVDRNVGVGTNEKSIDFSLLFVDSCA